MGNIHAYQCHSIPVGPPAHKMLIFCRYLGANGPDHHTQKWILTGRKNRFSSSEGLISTTSILK